MTQDEAKWAVAHRAIEFVEDGMRLGLGTGTTSTKFIHALSGKVRTGLHVRCVASSDASFTLAQSLGIDITTLDELPELDLYVDGADEVFPHDGQLDLIKGGGAALLREKIVASASRRFLVVADSTKLVDRLGKFPLPVEVIKMALPLVQPRLAALGLEPKLRLVKGGSRDGADPLLTDENNYILDCMAGPLADPAATAKAIRSIVGVVEHGLFLNFADIALIAGDDGVQELRASIPTILSESSHPARASYSHG
jgi:ribose 5-phosphate isomerase A